MTYRLLDLFSGIGGFSLGLERSGGFKTVAFCEIEAFPRKVLAKHWPEVPIYDDVRTLTADRLAADGIGVDAICGGFPCQDISEAGLGAGISDQTRSGLWAEYARIIRELRPQFIVVENVAALLGRGMDRVLGDLAALGMDAWWDCLRACDLGAPHIRDRVWLVAYPSGSQTGEQAARNCHRLFAAARSDETSQVGRRAGCYGGRAWRPEPSIRRVDDGISANVDRVGALGNAVVPQIPELIGRAILAAEASL